MVVRTFDDECGYLERVGEHCWKIKKGFQVRMSPTCTFEDRRIRLEIQLGASLIVLIWQPHMNVEGVFYVNKHLEKLMFDELKNACRPGMVGGFLPGVKQARLDISPLVFNEPANSGV